MQVVIYVRSNIPWESMTLHNFLKHPGHAANITKERQRDIMLERITWWNKLFSMSYFQYRRGLRDIATVCFDRIPGVDAVFRNFDALNNWLPQDEYAWVIPVDDDDWFAPNIADHCRDHNPEHFGMLTWGHFRVYTTMPTTPAEADYQYPHPFKENRMLYTNMYGVSTRALKKANYSQRKMILDHHARSHKLVRELPKAQEIHSSPAVLSATHKSMASFTQLQKVESQQALLETILQGKDAFMRTDPPNWVKPYAYRASELYHELLESRCDTKT